jgi:hypothetical protein
MIRRMLKRKKPEMSNPVEPSALAIKKIIYAESVRLLEGQSSSLDELRGRAGTLLAAASVVTAFLAPAAVKTTTVTARGISDAGVHFSSLAWAATGSFVAGTIAALVVLWPYTWTWAHNTHDLMDKFLDPACQRDEEELYYHLAYYNETHHSANGRKMKRLYLSFEGGCILLAGEIGFWIASIATSR